MQAQRFSVPLPEERDGFQVAQLFGQPATRSEPPNQKLRYAFYSFAAPSTGAAERSTDFRRTRKICLNRAAANFSSAGNPVRSLGTTGTDVVFVLDTTGSMSDTIEQTKQFIRDYSAKIKEMNGRVGLVVYRDAGDEYTAKKLSDLQTDTADLLKQLESVKADGGGDTPEAALHATMTALNTMNWKPGATKAIVLLTDADYHNPDRVDGSTVESVAKRSLEIDPVNVYPVISGQSEPHTELAEKTSGQVIVNKGDVQRRD